MPYVDKPLKRMIQLTTEDWVRYLTLEDPEEPVDYIEMLTEIAAPQAWTKEDRDEAVKKAQEETAKTTRIATTRENTTGALSLKSYFPPLCSK